MTSDEYYVSYLLALTLASFRYRHYPDFISFYFGNYIRISIFAHSTLYALFMILGSIKGYKKRKKDNEKYLKQAVNLIERERIFNRTRI